MSDKIFESYQVSGFRELGQTDRALHDNYESETDIYSSLSGLSTKNSQHTNITL